MTTYQEQRIAEILVNNTIPADLGETITRIAKIAIKKNGDIYRNIADSYEATELSDIRFGLQDQDTNYCVTQKGELTEFVD